MENRASPIEFVVKPCVKLELLLPSGCDSTMVVFTVRFKYVTRDVVMSGSIAQTVSGRKMYFQLALVVTARATTWVSSQTKAQRKTH